MSIDQLKPREAFGFLTWKTSRIYANYLAARFSEANVDVTVEQWRALVPLAKIPGGVTQGRLCELLSQEKTGVSRLVAALEKRGLILREPSDEDRRVKHLSITSDGLELVERAVEIVLSYQADLVKNIDPDELETCQKVLWQLIEENLDPIARCVPNE